MFLTLNSKHEINDDSQLVQIDVVYESNGNTIIPVQYLYNSDSSWSSLKLSNKDFNGSKFVCRQIL